MKDIPLQFHNILILIKAIYMVSSKKKKKKRIKKKKKAVGQQVHFDLKHEKFGNFMLNYTLHNNCINIYIYIFLGGSPHLKQAYNKQ